MKKITLNKTEHTELTEREGYTYLGDRHTDPSLRKKMCTAVKRNGKCIRGKNGNFLVEIEGKKVVVVGRLLRKVK